MKTCSVSALYFSYYLAFDEPAFFGIEDKSNRKPERNRKLQHHIDFLNAQVTMQAETKCCDPFNCMCPVCKNMPFAKQFTEALEML